MTNNYFQVIHPEAKKNTCIFQAIANALPLTYVESVQLLTRAACGQTTRRARQCFNNIDKALTGLGLKFTKYVGQNFSDFARTHAGRRYILLGCDHAAAAIAGQLVDSWDSSRKHMRGFWEITNDQYKAIEKQYGKGEEETMKTTATTNQPTTATTTAAIIPEVLPPEQPTAAIIPAPLQEKPNNLPGALLDLDERTLQLLKRQANLAATLPGVKSLQLVGRWLWLEFTGKPTEEIRQQLKDNRWSWAPKKGKWTYHNPEEPRPGKHRFMTFEEIESKHGSAAII